MMMQTTRMPAKKLSGRSPMPTVQHGGVVTRLVNPDWILNRQQLAIQNNPSIKLKCIAGRFDEKDAILHGNELPNVKGCAVPESGGGTQNCRAKHRMTCETNRIQLQQNIPQAVNFLLNEQLPKKYIIHKRLKPTHKN